MNKLIKSAKKWIKENKTEFYILLAILVLGAFLRLYKIDQYMTFLGDEGRDVVLVRRFLVYGDIFLIGPGTSIGNMYLGPLYYYMMAPALWLFNYSPVGPSLQIAILGIITIGFVWFAAREWFGRNAGLIASFLYAIAPTVIIYSRSSWNPNIMPFFALLCVFSIWRTVTTKKLYWLPVLGVSFAACLQSHYLALLLAPTLGIFWLYGAYLFKKSKNIKKYLVYSFVSLILFLALMSPLVIFDFRHGFQNFGAIEKFFLERQTTVSAKPWNSLPEIWPIFQEISGRLLAGRNEMFGNIMAVITVVGLFLVFRSRKHLNKKSILALVLIITWLLISFVGLGLYKQEIYDHYYGFFFAAPFLLFGGISSVIIDRAKIRGWWLVGTVLVFLTFYNFSESPIKGAPNRQLARSIEVADKIKAEAGGEKFNLAVIAERNYEDAYQYFLEKDNTGVTDIDPQNTKDTITDQLFVVCELPAEKCSPTSNPKAEVANFGWSKVEQTWEVAGVIVYKLVHVDNL